MSVYVESTKRSDTTSRRWSRGWSLCSILILGCIWLLIHSHPAQASPPVNPLFATCQEGEFLHIHSGSCLPLHTNYGFVSFSEPIEEVQLHSCDVEELFDAVSRGNRKVFLQQGCTYELKDRDLTIMSNTVIDGTGVGVGTVSKIHASTELSSTKKSLDKTGQSNTQITCTGTTAFRIHDVSNVIIRNLTIDGKNDQRDGRGCGTLVFIDEGADNILVERVRLRNGRGKGIGFRTATRVTARYNWVEDMWDAHGLNADKNFSNIAYYSNYVTRVGRNRKRIGYGINSHATKAEIAGNFIEDTDSGIKLMGARYTILHHNTVIGATSRNPLYRGVWTAVDDQDNIRPVSLVYYANYIDTGGVRPFSILDGATEIYLAGNFYGKATRQIPVSRESGVYQCTNSSDNQLTGNLIKVPSRVIEFPDSGMEPFDPCALQSDLTPSWLYASPPIIRVDPQTQLATVGERATFRVSVLEVPSPNASTDQVFAANEISYQWQRRFGQGRWFDIRNATESSYTTGRAYLYHNGSQYRVRVSNSFGYLHSQTAVLTIIPEQITSASCITASASWQSKPVKTDSSRFRATFLATPSDEKSDGLIGLSRTPADDFSDLAVIVRFGENGYVDVRDGARYAADELVPYRVGETLQFRLEIDVAKRIYSVYVATVNAGKVNDDEIELADDFRFRSEQKQIRNLGSWNFWDGRGNLEVCDLQP